ncbi:MAG TPA: hypothetical protein VNW97_16515 [Candidatus Saccharimonadales bacterium]|jgi:hypothetical protein|nr:hypothetical protein [Candidatus Saccharimonadales bacterium]
MKMSYARLARTGQALVFLLLLLAINASAKKRDPLSEVEVDQLREVAMEPLKRLQLYIKFAEMRLTEVDRLRGGPKEAQGRGKRIHDLLEDFTAILDEINDNLDQYQGRPLDKDLKKEFRKGLKEVLEAGAKWEARIATLKSAASADPLAKKESSDYRYVLQDAGDALKSTVDVAREYAETKEPEPAAKIK